MVSHNTPLTQYVWYPSLSDYPSVSPVGVVRQVKPLIGSLNMVLKLAMNYVTSGVVSHRNIVSVHIFVSEFWF